MNHIDAGTIHAWLDGALDATQSHEIEAHVAECSQCAAAVAEERGMIAGASRILLALDDVPAGVTPKRAPAWAPVARRRQWRAAPWVTGIAAALLLAVGVTTWNRDAVQKEMPATRDQATPAPVAQQGPRFPAALPETARRRTTSDVRTSTTAQSAPKLLSETRTERARDRIAAGAAAGAPGVAMGGAASAPSERASVTAAPGAPTPAFSNRAMAGVARESRAEIVRVDELAGCYSLKPAESGKAMMPTMSAPTEGAAKRSSRAPAPVAARADFAVTPPPAVVRLDTTRKSAGYIVYAATADSLIGYWNVAGDSATANLLMRGTFPISQRNRVDCPER